MTSFFFTPGSSVHFGGSRSLQPNSQLEFCVRKAQAAGCSIHVGCAAGADAQVIYAALAAVKADYLAETWLNVFAVGGNSGGWPYPRLSPPPWIIRAISCVRLWAGGCPSLPLRARLIRRSLAALAGCSCSVFFLSGPSSHGSLTVAAHAVKSGMPVFVFCPVQPDPLTSPSPAGSWQPAELYGLSCWRWSPAAVQPKLF